MNKTASHNTKRGEDARARLNVLSDIPAKWFEMIEDWHRINLPEIEKLGAPEKNDEYFIYQTIAGILPMDGIVTDTVKNRLKEYITNAVKETRGHEFAWNEEKNAYKNNTLEFINTILEPEHPFYKSLYQFHHQIKDFGILNSLSQQIIKFTAPGIPAIYQGGELWDFSLVSPDNRGPVDFNYREDILNELLERFAENPLKSIQELWEERNIGKIKLWILHKLLHERKISSGAFEKGEYIPLQTSGAFKDKILAYIRRYHEHIYLVIIPLHLASIADKFNINNIDWADTKIHLPEAMPDEWDCLFTKQKYNLDRDIQVSELLKKIPFLCCKGITQQNEKGSGVLLHISSLPSSFGSGDLGPQAYQFADYLSQNGQKYWQILPLNPIEKGKGYSPYNSYSAFGGNTLLINPYLLIKYNLIRKEEIDGLRIKDKHYAQFDKTKKAKDWLFEIIYRRYCKFPPSSLKYEFNHFKEKESYWLHDHALFVALKHYFNKPWFDWPEKYKHRSRKVLEEFATKSHHAIEKEKFFQFLFYKQWHDLKDYCNAKNIRLFGDMPIYVSYDSVDVWVHPDYFKMNKNKEPLAVAGVPPDYFSKTGQLWGMPVFNWDHIKADNYEWWVNRIAKNLEFFDLLRIDHFRGLSAYWEVPAGEPTAENGYYVDVPGYELFDKIKERMGELPIVAEDLGEIDQPVYDLRDHYGFPGMRVLQFGFGEDQEHSPHYPGHDVPNAIVYTGTHDNNTLRGWYKKELNPEDKKRMQDFTGKKVRGGNVHNVLIHTAMQTNSRIVITPMQDILGKGEKAVMNKPGTTEDNWLWKMTGKDRKKARKSSFLLNETKESKRL
jgi:4-alpha-glucanotransferase